MRDGTGQPVAVSAGGAQRTPSLGDTNYFTATMSGTPPVDTDTYTEDCTLEITDKFGNVRYAHNPRMRGRGNSTWAAPKKPFKVRSRDRLQRPFHYSSSRDWALMADWFDQSYSRTSIAFEIYRRATGRWAPRSQHVWLDWPEASSIAGGLYRYSETMDLQANRVDFRAMEETDIAGNALTGPYFVETDDYYDSAGFRSVLDTPVIWDSPEANAEQAAYMESWTNEAEAALVSGTAANISNYLDMPSFVDWYLIQELARNNDARWFKSIKWVKDQDSPNGTGKAIMVSPWDLDLSMGNSWSGAVAPTGWNTRLGPAVPETTGRPNWMYYAWERWPGFQDAVVARWESAFVPAVGTLRPWLARLQESIEPFIEADRALWHAGSQHPNNTIPGVMLWVDDRMAWMDSNF